jgi:hypothetical protein
MGGTGFLDQGVYSFNSPFEYLIQGKKICESFEKQIQSCNFMQNRPKRIQLQLNGKNPGW